MITYSHNILELSGTYLFICIACALVLLALLVAISIVDIKTRTIPNFFVLAISTLGIICAFLSAHGYAFPLINVSLGERFFGLLVAFVPIFLVACLVGGIGGGDIKLIAALGFLFGLSEAIILLVCTCVIGGIAGIVKLVTGKVAARKTQFDSAKANNTETSKVAARSPQAGNAQTCNAEADKAMANKSQVGSVEISNTETNNTEPIKTETRKVAASKATLAYGPCIAAGAAITLVFDLFLCATLI